MSDTILTDFQADLTHRLAADEFFQDIPVLDERKGDLVPTIEQALGTLTAVGGKMGLCVVVLSPVGTDEMPDLPNGPLELSIAILVLENVLVNNTAGLGTGKAALTVARRVHRVLKHYTPHGLVGVLIPMKPSLVPVDSELAPVAYEVRFKATEARSIGLVKVSTPTISPTNGADPQTVTLSCATAGASIYYTVDGSHPRVGNAAATLYAGPFQVLDAMTVRAAAFKAGCVGSDVNMAVFS